MASTALRDRPLHRRSERPMYQEIIKDDACPAPAALTEYSEVDIPIPAVPRERYTSQAFFDLEVERMWSRVWQMACREEQIPEVGDTLLYEGPDLKLMIVRTAEDEIKAFYNSCPHRGMKLCAADTSLTQIRCPYHGFSWEIDGTMKRLPAAWDFPQIDKERFDLPQVKVGLWDGFVFVNKDPDAAPLTEYLANLPDHFADWSRRDVYLATIVRKVMPANWKACIEGFVEAFHVSELHSQVRTFSGDSSTQYDVWPGNETISRFVEPTGVQSDSVEETLGEPQIFDAMMRMMTDSAEAPQLPEGTTVRQAMSDLIRKSMSQEDAAHFKDISDAEVIDAVQYSIFPNLILFRSLGYPFAYRFVPLAGDPNRTTFDFMIFKPKPKDGSPLPEVDLVTLGADDLYSECGVFPPWLGHVYDQDTEGFGRLQDGLHSGSPAPVLFAQYQEVRIRHLHQTLMRYLSDDPAA